MATLDLHARPTQLLLWGRAVVVGTVALATGVVAHVAGGGFLPGALVMVFLLGACVAASAAFLLRPASGLRLTALVVVGQSVAHGVLSATAGHAGDVPLMAPPVPSGTGPLASTDGSSDLFGRYEQLTGGVGHVDAGVSVAEWWNHQVDHLTQAGGLMVLSHLVGAAVLGIFLAVGENAVWRLVALVLARRSVRLGVLARQYAQAGARYGVHLQRFCLIPLVAQVSGAQLLARPARRHRGPPFVLAA